MNPVNPVDPDLPDLPVQVPRASIEQLGAGVRALIALVVAFGLLFAWSTWHAQQQDRHQDETDERLEATADQLATLVAAEAHEEKLEQANACVQSHLRYGGLKELLRRIGERTSMTDVEVAGLLEGFPPPVCDLAAAQDALSTG